MPHNCCVSFSDTNSKKNKLRFHRLPKKQEQKDRWIAKIRRDDVIFFTVTDDTRVLLDEFQRGGLHG